MFKGVDAKYLSNMAEIVEKAPSTTTTTAAATPVEQLVAESTTSYTRPMETYPAPTTTETIAIATATPIAPKTVIPTASTPIAETRPQAMPDRPVIQLMIDPAIGVGTVPASSGGGGGGFGGGSPEEKTTGTATKKSWLPIILIGIGVIVIASKFIKKAKA